MTSSRTLTLLLAAIACALVLFTACGGSDSTPTPSPTVGVTIDPNATLTARPTRPATGGPDVCSLISPASVVTLIGALSGTTSPDSGQCDYTGAGGNLTVQLEAEPTVAAATTKLGVVSSGAEAVSAGDAAFFSGSQVTGRKGLYFFLLSTTVQKDNLKDALTALAQSAAASLPAS